MADFFSSICDFFSSIWYFAKFIWFLLVTVVLIIFILWSMKEAPKFGLDAPIIGIILASFAIYADIRFVYPESKHSVSGETVQIVQQETPKVQREVPDNKQSIKLINEDILDSTNVGTDRYIYANLSKLSERYLKFVLNDITSMSGDDVAAYNSFYDPRSLQPCVFIPDIILPPCGISLLFAGYPRSGLPVTSRETDIVSRCSTFFMPCMVIWIIRLHGN